jgi:hypothetical protein
VLQVVHLLLQQQVGPTCCSISGATEGAQCVNTCGKHQWMCVGKGFHVQWLERWLIINVGSTIYCSRHIPLDGDACVWGSTLARRSDASTSET